MNSLNQLKDNITQYVVRPLNAFGLGGFIFDIYGDTEIDLSTEITDHFLEDNSTVQDHIAVKPKRVTLGSYVGELKSLRTDDITSTEKLVQKLTVLNQFLPTISKISDQVRGAQSIDELGDKIKNTTVNQVTDYWAFLKNLSNAQNDQSRVYQYFKALMEQKILVSVQTPFEYMTNMAIESVTAIQSEETEFMSDFTVTLKHIRTVSRLQSNGQAFIENQTPLSESNQGRSALQFQPPENLGQVQGDPPLSNDDRSQIFNGRFG